MVIYPPPTGLSTIAAPHARYFRGSRFGRVCRKKNQLPFITLNAPVIATATAAKSRAMRSAVNSVRTVARPCSASASRRGSSRRTKSEGGKGAIYDKISVTLSIHYLPGLPRLYWLRFWGNSTGLFEPVVSWREVYSGTSIRPSPRSITGALQAAAVL